MNGRELGAESDLAGLTSDGLEALEFLIEFGGFPFDDGSAGGEEDDVGYAQLGSHANGIFKRVGFGKTEGESDLDWRFRVRMLDFAWDGLFAVESGADDAAISGQQGDFIAGTETEDGTELLEFFFGQGDGLGGIEVWDLDKCAGEGAEGDHWVILVGWAREKPGWQNPGF